VLLGHRRADHLRGIAKEFWIKHKRVSLASRREE
jgi:hypothetical protein